MQGFRCYQRFAAGAVICAVLALDLKLSSLGGTAHVTQLRIDSAAKGSITKFVNKTTVEDITVPDGCEMLDSVWKQHTFYFAHYTNGNGFSASDNLQLEEILELPFKPLFCSRSATDVATLTL
ncbi:MAG: hypothetical protein Dbin4_00686 [Alphaproteobacteria bacterium]|nr:hypothetical protein [Alphaproteobacteria bacterium]